MKNRTQKIKYPPTPIDAEKIRRKTLSQFKLKFKTRFKERVPPEMLVIETHGQLDFEWVSHFICV